MGSASLENVILAVNFLFMVFLLVNVLIFLLLGGEEGVCGDVVWLDIL